GVGSVDGGAGGERGAVRISAGVEGLVDGVPERDDDRAPVVERVVEGEERRLLPAVRGLGGGEGGGDLVAQLPVLPELPGEVEKHLQLCGNVPEPRRRAEGQPVRPDEILQCRDGLLVDRRLMAAPGLIPPPPPPPAPPRHL